MTLHRFAKTAGLIVAILFLIRDERMLAQSGAPNASPKITVLGQQLAELGFEIQTIETEKSSAEAGQAEAKIRADELDKMRSDLLRQQYELGVSNVSYDEIIRLLQTQRVQLSVDLAGIEARREILVAQRESGQKNAEEQEEPLSEMINQLIEIQQERLSSVEALRAKGSAPTADVLNAKQQLLETQIRLAEKNHAANDNRGSSMDPELLNVSLVRAETAARLNKVNQLLGEYVSARKTIDSLGRVQSEIGAVESSLLDFSRKSKKCEELLSRSQFRKEQLNGELKRLEREPKNDDED